VRYITLEKMFEYEHSSKYNVSSESRGSLVKEIEGDDFHLSPIQWKIMLNDIEAILDKHSGKGLEDIRNEFIEKTGTEYEVIIEEMFRDLNDFIYTDPKIPDTEKNYTEDEKPDIRTEHSREEIIDKITKNKDKSETSLLALYVYRQMDDIDWVPFVKAAIERNPVSFNDLYEKSNYEVYTILKALPVESIYDNNRLALPDEVWNFQRGDGVEKALLLAGFIIHKEHDSTVRIEIENSKVRLSSNGHDFHFLSNKSIRKTIQISGNLYKIE
jgi:hypothetical protein